MKKSNPAILLCALLLAVMSGMTVTGCSSADDPQPFDEPQVELTVRVSTADISGSRIGDDDLAKASDEELMHSLRIMIVRADGTVEWNRHWHLVTGDENVGADNYTDGVSASRTFRVSVGSALDNSSTLGEEKKIYVFANEELAQWTSDGDNASWISDYLDKFKRGYILTPSDVADLKGQFLNAADVAKTPLFMSECHTWRATVPTKENPAADQSVAVFLTRAAVKFTINVVSNANQKYARVTGIKLRGMANKEYLLPRAQYNILMNSENGGAQLAGGQLQAAADRPATDPVGTIYSYEVPQWDMVYSDYEYDLTDSPISLNGGGSVVFYQPESGYALTPGNQHSISICLDAGDGESGGWTEFAPLKELPYGLPRNTHVVINITVRDNGLDWEVKLRPYTSIELKPNFGIEVPKS